MDEDARQFLQRPEQMLKPDAQGDPDFQPYWDPLLKRDDRLYKRFIRKLDKAGFFGVHQLTEEPLRSVLCQEERWAPYSHDSGLSRYQHAVQRRTGLPELSLFPQTIEPGTKEFADFMDEQKVGIRLSDVKDCFHRLRQPFWLSEYFCLDPVPAEWVNLVGMSIHGQTLAAGDLVWPAPGSLCMGFTWSLFFAQRVSERLMTMVPSLACSRLVNDRSGAIVFDQSKSTDDEASLRHYVYVDNLGLLSTNHVTAEKGIREVEAVFTEH